MCRPKLAGRQDLEGPISVGMTAELRRVCCALVVQSERPNLVGFELVEDVRRVCGRDDLKVLVYVHHSLDEAHELDLSQGVKRLLKIVQKHQPRAGVGVERNDDGQRDERSFAEPVCGNVFSGAEVCEQLICGVFVGRGLSDFESLDRWNDPGEIFGNLVESLVVAQFHVREDGGDSVAVVLHPYAFGSDQAGLRDVFGVQLQENSGFESVERFFKSL